MNPKKRLTIRVGSAVVTIYPISDRNRYCVVYHVGNKRHREIRAHLEDAKQRATEVARNLSAQKGEAAVTLTASEASMFKAAVERLKPLRVPLNTAVDEYVAARERIGSHSLLDAVEHFAKQTNLNLPPKTLREVTVEMLQAKLADGASRRYQQNLRYYANNAATVLTKPIREITSAEIDDYLRSLPVSSRTRQNVRGGLVTLFAFARSRHYLPRDRATAADLSTRVKARTGEIEIFTPVEMRKLLNAASEVALPLIAIGGFAGLRTAEIARLDWGDVNFSAGHIVVSAAKSKTASRRIVPMPENLQQWLALYSGRKGKVLPIEHFNTCCKLENETAKTAKVTWKHNGLRHSAISYRIAQCGDVARVSLEAGNSPQMIFKHYRELVTPRDAAAWWAITPERASNVIPMQAKAQLG